jgi:hypothetical protein
MYNKFLPFFNVPKLLSVINILKFFIFRAMLGKVPTLLLRLSCILQALHDSFEYIMSLDSSERFILDSKIEERLNFESRTQTIISLENIERAYQLLQYFNKNKLVLANYEIDTNIDIELTFDKLITELSTEIDTNTGFPLESMVIKEILESKEKKINMTSLNGNDSIKSCC